MEFWQALKQQRALQADATSRLGLDFRDYLSPNGHMFRSSEWETDVCQRIVELSNQERGLGRMERFEIRVEAHSEQADKRIVANELVPVYETDSGDKIVDARELHAFLSVGRDFSTWMKERIQKYGFVEGEDFSPVLGKTSGGRPSVEYVLKLDMAKELCMVENNEQGSRARKYFIEVERRFKSQSPAVDLSKLDPNLQALYHITQSQIHVQMQLAETKQEVGQLKEAIQVANHRIDSLDAINVIGDMRQRFNAMIRKYATSNGLLIPQGYKDFRAAWNNSFHGNITLAMENYMRKNGLKKLSMPDYLERTAKLEDAIRVADKMLNRQMAMV